MRLHRGIQRLVDPLIWLLIFCLFVLRYTGDSPPTTTTTQSSNNPPLQHVEGANFASRTLNSAPRFNLTGPLEQGDFTWQILVEPKEQIMICHIWKSGSTLLNRLYSRLIGDPDANQFANGNYTRSAEGCDWFKERRKEWPLPGRNDVNCNNNHVQGILVLHMYQPLDSNASMVAVSPDWRRIIMVREPIDRFISGVFDKCLRKRDAADMQGHCPVAEYTRVRNKEWFSNITNQRDVITRVLALAEAAKSSDGVLFRIDPHFASQKHYCGNRRGMQWDHVAVYDAEHMDDVVRGVLKATNIPDDVMNGWGPGKNETMVQTGQYHKTLRTQTTFERMREVLTPELAKRIMKLYEVDYELFPILRRRVPEWVGAG